MANKVLPAGLCFATAGSHKGNNNAYIASGGGTAPYTQGSDGDALKLFSSGELANTVIKTCVVEADWAWIEQTNNVFTFTTLDADISRAMAGGATNIKLRIYCGVYAPSWLSALRADCFIPHWYDGSSQGAGGVYGDGNHYGLTAQVNDTNYKGVFSGGTEMVGNAKFTSINAAAAVPKWWHPDYLGYYRRLMVAVANHVGPNGKTLDLDPIIQSIQVTGAMSIYGEMMIHQTSEMDGTDPSTYSPVTLTVTSGNATITAAAHPFTTGHMVLASTVGTTGFAGSQLYRVVKTGANTLQLQLNGATVTPTGSSTTMTIKAQNKVNNNRVAGNPDGDTGYAAWSFAAEMTGLTLLTSAHLAAWPNTPSVLCCNPYSVFRANGSPSNDEDIAGGAGDNSAATGTPLGGVPVLQYFAQQMGNLAIIQNNSLRPTNILPAGLQLGVPYTTVNGLYDDMQRSQPGGLGGAGGRVMYQSAAASVFQASADTPGNTLKAAVAEITPHVWTPGSPWPACGFEMPIGSPPWISKTDAVNMDAALRLNAANTNPNPPPPPPPGNTFIFYGLGGGAGRLGSRGR